MHPYLFPGLRVSPKVVSQFLERIPEDRMDVPTHPDRFSPREVIAHLADWEPIFVVRMQQTLDHPGSTIMGIDEGEMAIRNGYSTSNWQEQLAIFVAEREKTIAYIQALSPEQLRIEAVHNEKGPLAVEDHANMLLGHDLYHIDQLFAVLP